MAARANQLLTILLTVAALVAEARTASAAMVRVGRNERCSTIVAGVNTAQPGDTVLVTPAEAAQEVADRLVALGVKAILNFAPVQLVVPDDVVVKTVNLALELETLSYALASR